MAQKNASHRRRPRGSQPDVIAKHDDAEARTHRYLVQCLLCVISVFVRVIGHGLF